jgi:hypothetical protein
MKALIIGWGLVGTILRWALSKAGIDVTHVVGKEGLPGTDTLDLLDLRPGYPKNTSAVLHQFHQMVLHSGCEESYSHHSRRPREGHGPLR